MKTNFRNCVIKILFSCSVCLLLLPTLLGAQNSRRNTFDKNPYRSHYQRLDAGNLHTLEIRGGTLWAWGNRLNNTNWFGKFTYSPASTPFQIGRDDDWVSVAAGESHSLALKADGTLWAWGTNTFGELGDGTNRNRSTPVKIGSHSDWISISCGANYSFAIKSDGTLWAWGNN